MKFTELVRTVPSSDFVLTAHSFLGNSISSVVKFASVDDRKIASRPGRQVCVATETIRIKPQTFDEITNGSSQSDSAVFNKDFTTEIHFEELK